MNKTPMMVAFPLGNAMVQAARNESGVVIGVNVVALVFPEDFQLLPEMLRTSAYAVHAHAENHTPNAGDRTDQQHEGKLS